MGQTKRAEQFIDAFAAWAQGRDDIQSVFVAGSFGRQTNHSADTWSDIDLAFVTTRPQDYADYRQWLPQLGTVWAAIYDLKDPLPGLSTSASMFTTFDNGLIVDFSIVPLRRTWWWLFLWLEIGQLPFLKRFFPNMEREVAATAFLFKQGVRILFDDGSFVAQMQYVVGLRATPQPQPPSQDEFEFLLHDFWYGAPHIVRYLMRGQAYGAKAILDRPMKRTLGTMVRWHAQSRDGDWDNLLLYRDKYVERWADERFVQAMPKLFGAYGDADAWQALLVMMEIFQQLSHETAEQLGYECDYPAADIMAWVWQQYEVWQARGS